MQARASGADAILLIAAVLPNSDITYFCKAAASLGMVCLVEVHTEAELARVLQADGIDSQILGINNRDLGTFEVPPTTPPLPALLCCLFLRISWCGYIERGICAALPRCPGHHRSWRADGQQVAPGMPVQMLRSSV